VKTYLAIAVLAACSQSATPRAPKRRAGELMIEVGMRFERSQRAVAAGRWELAAYDVHELREVFEDDLLPGKWADNPAMRHDAQVFLAGALLELEAAARVKDRGGWDGSFGVALKACNACHDVAHVGFIEVDATGAMRVAR
jgi:cytochrome c556